MQLFELIDDQIVSLPIIIDFDRNGKVIGAIK